MIRFATPVLCVLGLSITLTAWAAPPPVSADRTSIAPGQAVNLRWNFSGNKIVASGGRFGKGIDVTKKTYLTDRPKKTTRYTFTVFYKGMGNAPKTAKRIKKSLQARYDIVIQVVPVPSLNSYHASRGWQINYIKGWKPEPVTTALVGKNGLVFFQPEDDSIERLAVAMLPSAGLTTQELMQKITADMVDKYDDPEVLKQEEILYRNAPALWVSFTGRSRAHDGTRTQSFILAFVYDGQAYFVSARTAAAQFDKKKTMLETMVKSIVLPTPVRSARTVSKE
jgi:hypothetical protein